MIKDLISVIVPVYNVCEYLEHCVKSIVHQTYQNIEIILVDDGSTDGSEIICDKLAEMYDKIKVYHQENRGLSGARNTGMRYANGEFIYFIDSDDFIDRNMLNTMYSIMIMYHVDIVECEFRKVANNEFLPLSNYTVTLSNQKDIISSTIDWKKHYCVVWNKLFRRKIINNISFLENCINEDEFYFNEYITMVDRVAHISIPFYYYRIRNGSIMNTSYSLERAKSFVAYIERYYIIKKCQPSLCSKYLRFLSIRYFYLIKHISQLSNDKEYIIRKTLSNQIIMLYDELMDCNDISVEHKKYYEELHNNMLKLLKKLEVRALYETYN